MHIANTKLLIIVTLELWTIAESQQFFHQVCYSLNWKKRHKMFLMLVRIIRTFYQNLKIQHKIIWKKKSSSLFFTQIIGCFLNRMNCYACRKSFINPSIIFDHFMLTYHFPLFFSQLENMYF